MPFPFIAAAIAAMAGANYLSNRAQRKSDQSINAQNVASQEAANAQNIAFQRETNVENLAFAREQMRQQENFAKMGVQWRAQDAASAGFHPLAALGAQGASYSPVASVGVAPSVQAPVRGRVQGTSGAAGLLSVAGEMMYQHGQDIRRAKLATMTPDELEMQAEQLRGMRLDNDLKAQELMGQGLAGYSPAVGVPGSVAIPDSVKHVPSEVISYALDNNAIEAGIHPGGSTVNLGGGLVIKGLGKDIGQRLGEDNTIAQTAALTWLNMTPYQQSKATELYRAFKGTLRATGKELDAIQRALDDVPKKGLEAWLWMKQQADRHQGKQKYRGATRGQ